MSNAKMSVCRQPVKQFIKTNQQMEHCAKRMVTFHLLKIILSLKCGYCAFIIHFTGLYNKFPSSSEIIHIFYFKWDFKFKDN